MFSKLWRRGAGVCAWRWPSLRSLRWCSGWILLVYVTVHLCNHALGLLSLSAAEAMRHTVHSLWRSSVLSVVLYGALAVHAAMALVAVAQRRVWRMPPIEALRLALGVVLPVLMAGHIASTRWASTVAEVANTFERVVPSLWHPWSATLQLVLLVCTWSHACMGLHFAYRGRPGWRQWQPVLLTAAVLLPVLAMLGMLSMAREMGAQTLSVASLPAAAAQSVQSVKWGLRWGWCALLVLAIAVPWGWRKWRQQRSHAGHIQLQYPQRTVQVPLGWSVLEASRAHGIAHLSLCGGRARCSTCRVRVKANAAALPAPDADERATLARVHAPADVRLACQLRPRSNVRVTPLFHSTPSAWGTSYGVEQEVVVVFVDLRQWSVLSDRQWPMDLSWVLERYFSLVGTAIQQCGGIANQFIGDSVMAIFGRDTDRTTAARQALQAVIHIEQQLDAWSTSFVAQFGQRLDFGVGMHAGNVLLGQVGFEHNTTFTAVGEVVNTCSRLQEHTKLAQARLVLSAEVAHWAQVQAQLGPPQQVHIRGRAQPLQLYQVRSPAMTWPEGMAL